MVTFTRTAYASDVSTGALTPTVTTITGEAMQVRGSPQQYAALSLLIASAVTLFFSPTSYPLAANGDAFVRPGDVVAWAGGNYTVKSVDPIAEDGYIIAARIVVAT